MSDKKAGGFCCPLFWCKDSVHAENRPFSIVIFSINAIKTLQNGIILNIKLVII